MVFHHLQGRQWDRPQSRSQLHLSIFFQFTIHNDDSYLTLYNVCSWVCSNSEGISQPFHFNHMIYVVGASSCRAPFELWVGNPSGADKPREIPVPYSYTLPWPWWWTVGWTWDWLYIVSAWWCHSGCESWRGDYIQTLYCLYTCVWENLKDGSRAPDVLFSYWIRSLISLWMT